MITRRFIFPITISAVLLSAQAASAQDLKGKLMSQWDSGTVQPGAQSGWIWNNAENFVYKVGFSPEGATTSDCQFEVVNSWDEELDGGERRFHFDIENTGKIACSTTILLGAESPVTEDEAGGTTLETGGLNPGGTANFSVFANTGLLNVDPAQVSFNVNVAPSGATFTDACQLKVVPFGYEGSTPTAGFNSFNFQVMNIGKIACTGTALVAINTNVETSWPLGSIAAGASSSWTWNNANPLNRVYVPGVFTDSLDTCQLEFLPSTYKEVMNPDGSNERIFTLGVKNTGDETCTGTMLLNFL
jgi:hypothetical protein